MKEKSFLPDSLIIRCLSVDYDIQVATLAFLPIGADLNAWAYKANSNDDISYFVKLKQGPHPEISTAIAELLHKAGIQQVIPPIKTIHGRATQQLGDFTLIVYPFIEGQDGFSQSLTECQWVELGSALRRVHELNVPSLIQEKVRMETYSSKWRVFVRSLYVHLEEEPMDVVATCLVRFMKQNIVAIQRLVDRAGQLGEELQRQTPKWVLCHSDLHAGNVLLGRNDTLYIVDWDDPIMAPKERDLMFIGGGVGNVWNKPEEETLFYKGYGNTDIDAITLSYYRHERIVEDIAEFGREILLTKGGGENRPEMFKHFVAMFEPRGVVDIAFKTDLLFL